MEAAEITAVADKLAELLARAGESGAGAFNSLAAEYRVMCIGYCVLGALLTCVAALACWRIVVTARRWNDEDTCEESSVARCIIYGVLAVVTCVAGPIMIADRLVGALAPHYSLLWKLLH